MERHCPGNIIGKASNSDLIRMILDDEASALEEEELLAPADAAKAFQKCQPGTQANLTLGDRMADKIALFAGSWKFIGLFMGILLLWILLNSVALFAGPFDPYPFILMNLILSCVAALQAPGHHDEPEPAGEEGQDAGGA